MIYAFSGFTLNDRSYELRDADRLISVERRVFDVIAYLVRNRGRVVPKAELFRSVWSGRTVTDASLSIVITAARRALGDDPTKQSFIATHHGRGYRFVAEVVELDRETDPNSRPSPDRRDLLVGRAAELQLLETALCAARAGRLQLVLLSGEAGIGKTRLIEHFASRLNHSGHVALISRSPEEPGAPPFWPWIQTLRGYLESIAPSDLSGFLFGVEDVGHLIPEIRHSLPPSRPPLADSLQARFRLFDALSVCLERAARRTPLAIFLDDIHRADEASLLLLSYISNAISSCPLFLVATYRDMHRSALFSRTVASLNRSPSSHDIPLAGLPSEDAGVLLETISGRKLRAPVIAALHSKSGGNPFFLSQLARNLDSLLVGDRIGSLPTNLAAAVAMHIEDVAPETRRILELAAAIGSEISASLLAEVAEMATEELLQLIQEAVEARILSPTSTPGIYRFSHALLRDAIYQRLEPVRRMRFHERIASAMAESLSTAVELQYLPTIAHHYCEAAPLGAIDEAIRYSRRAGDSASARFAYEDAANHYERALEILDLHSPGGGSVRCDLLEKLGSQLTKSGNRDKAKEVFDRLARLAGATGASSSLAEAALGIAPGVLALEFGVTDGFQIDLARAALQSIGDSYPVLRAKLLARLSVALHWSDGEDAIRLLVEEAAAIAKSNPSADLSSNVLQAAWFAARDPRAVGDRLDLAKGLIELDAGSVEPESRLVSEIFYLTSLLEMGELAQFDLGLERYRQLAEDLRQPQALWYTWMLDGMRALLAGEFRQAATLVDRFTALGRKVNDANSYHSAIAHTLIIRYATGGLEELLPAAHDVSRRYPSLVGWRASIPWLLANLGRHDEAAEELLRLGLRDFNSLPRRLDWPATAVLLSETAALLQDSSIAEVLYEALLPLRDKFAIIGLGVVNWGCFSRHLGLLAGCLGDWPRAVEHLECALEMNEAIGAHPWVAHTQVDLARALLKHRAVRLSKQRSARLLASAEAKARRLGMPVLASEALQLAERVRSA